MSAAPSQDELIFNVVFTPSTFRYLRYFLASLVACSDARFRIVANGCRADELREMERFVGIHPARVIDVLRVPTRGIATHGEALTFSYDSRDSSDYFCFVDSDVKARGRWVEPLVGELVSCAALTSGTVAWGARHVSLPDAPWLTGASFFGADGFVFGSPYLALYERAAVDGVRDAWGVDFRGSAHSALPDGARTTIRAMGFDYEMYDTAKVVNILLQADGHRVRYVENEQILHLGGISEHLSDPSTREQYRRGEWPARPLLAHSGQGRSRWDFSSSVAAILIDVVDEGYGLPERAVDPDVTHRLREIEPELVELVESYRHDV